MVAVEWKKEAANLSLVVSISANTLATMYVPALNENDATDGISRAANTKGIKFLRMENGAAVYEAGSGNHRFISKLKE